MKLAEFNTDQHLQLFLSEATEDQIQTLLEYAACGQAVKAGIKYKVGDKLPIDQIKNFFKTKGDPAKAKQCLLDIKDNLEPKAEEKKPAKAPLKKMATLEQSKANLALKCDKDKKKVTKGGVASCEEKPKGMLGKLKAAVK